MHLETFSSSLLVVVMSLTEALKEGLKKALKEALKEDQLQTVRLVVVVVPCCHW
jgi:ABC-type sulfate transport system permease subunit